jgi:hypothetical protein
VIGGGNLRGFDLDGAQRGFCECKAIAMRHTEFIGSLYCKQGIPWMTFYRVEEKASS